MPVCIVIASIGRLEILETVKGILDQNRDITIVASLYNPTTAVESKLEELGIETIVHNFPGASNGRNQGIERSLQLSKEFLGYIFPNDRTEYSSGSLAAAEDFLVNKTEIIGIGTWISEFDEILLSPRKEYSKDLDFLRSFEPALVIPSSLIKRGLRFDLNFGTGALTKWQSAESAKLLLDAKKMGASVVPIEKFLVRNQGSSKFLSNRERAEKGYRYGRGSGRYIRISSRLAVRLTEGIVFSLAPIGWYILGKSYWRNAGITFALASTVGRFRGLFSQFEPE